MTVLAGNGPIPDLSPGVREFLIAIADDKHLMGQQHAEWIGVAPFIEEDLAFCSIGQDELGHAALVYELIVGPNDEAVDRLALGRSGDEYRSCWLTECPIDDWAQTLVRHWMFDTADALRWAALRESTLEPLRAVSATVEREETYHRRHADGLLDLLMADQASAELVRSGLVSVAPLALGLFEPVAGEVDALAEGVVAAPMADALPAFRHQAAERFGPIEWGVAPTQQARTLRSDAFAPLMARMREVYDLDPDATW